jgi:WD40 repeat protein
VNVPPKCLSQDGQWQASAAGVGKRGDIREWGALPFFKLEAHLGYVRCVSFSRDGRRLASGSDMDNSIIVWDVKTGRPGVRLKGHSGAVTCVCFSPDGKRLASGGADQAVRIWDLTTGLEVLTLNGHKGGITWVSFSPDGRRLASASLDGTVRVWEALDEPTVLTRRGFGETTRVAFSPDGQRLMSAHIGRGIVVWGATTGQELFTIPGLHDNFCLSANGTRLAGRDRLASCDNVWDTTTAEEVAAFALPYHSDKSSWWDVCNPALSPDGKLLASGSVMRYENNLALPGEVRIWDVDRRREIFRLMGHDQPVVSVCFSPDGTRLASASPPGVLQPGPNPDRSSGQVKVWNTRTGQELLSIPGFTGGENDLCFSPDGSRLAAGSGVEVRNVAVRPFGGARPATGGTWGVKVWDVATGQEVLALKGHAGGITSVCFSADGRKLATSSDDTIKVWHAGTGRELLQFRDAAGGIANVCFSPDGKRLASGAKDGTVKIWLLGRAGVRRRP